MRWEYTQPIYEVADRQVNIDTFTGNCCMPEGRQQPGALQSLLQGVRAAHRYRLEPELEVRIPGGLRDLDLPGRHGREPAVAAEPAVLPRIQRQLRHPYAEHDPRWASRMCRPPARWTDLGPAQRPFYQGRAWDQQLRPQFTQQYQPGDRVSIRQRHVA